MADRERYAFEGWMLDVPERRLLSAREAITLPPKAYDLLVTLVRNAGRLVTKRELLAQVWSECSVEAGILAVHVSGLRKALGDASRSPQYIETVQSFGYRFIAPIIRLDEHQRLSSAPRFDTPVVEPRRLQVAEHLRRGRSHVLSASRVELPQAEAAFRAARSTRPMPPRMPALLSSTAARLRFTRQLPRTLTPRQSSCSSRPCAGRILRRRTRGSRFTHVPD